MRGGGAEREEREALMAIQLRREVCVTIQKWGERRENSEKKKESKALTEVCATVCPLTISVCDLNRVASAAQISHRMQRNCIFPGRYTPLTYYDWLRGRPRNTLMARNAREICNLFAHLYLHNG